jgi:S1-C subfamily serine protease
MDLPAELYVLKNGEMFGPFREEQLRRGVEEGHFAPEDFVQIEGQEAWHPIGRMLGMDGAESAGVVTPDWVSLLRWAWLRLRYDVGEQSFAAGSVFLGIGTLALALSRWPFLFWLPWFGATVVCAIPLLRRRKREAHGALLLVGVVCIPFLFIIFGSKKHESPSAGDGPSANAALRALAKAQPAPFPTPAPGTPRLESHDSHASPQPAGSLSDTPAPERVTPHYAPIPSPDASPAAPASNPAAKPSTPAAIPPTAPASTPAPEVDFAHEHGDALVIINGSEGSGSGFICNFENKTMLFTNAHVIADITDPIVTRLDGAIVSAGVADVAAGSDIVRLAPSQMPAHPLEVISNFTESVHIGDAVVVMGNSGGGGVVTKIDGNIIGIGPDRIEVSAEFIPGNSGSPIIHVKTGQVVGIATYLTKTYEEFVSDTSGSAPPAPGAKKAPLGTLVVRRFGYRIDNVPGWERVEWKDFRSEAAMMRQISTLTEDVCNLFKSLQARQDPVFATTTLRRPALAWMGVEKTDHVSEVDRKEAWRGLLNSLRFMMWTDVTAAEPQLHYTYFKDELRHQRHDRDILYKIFNEQSAELSAPANHPTSIHKSH